MKTMKLFKVAREIKPGEFAPLFVNAHERWHVGEVIHASSGERLPDGHVKSKLGALMYSPGLHCLMYPSYPIIGHKEQGVVVCMKPDQVWLEVEADITNSYCDEAADNARNTAGHVVAAKVHLDHVPVNGFYRRMTNAASGVETICTSSMKVLRVVPQAEVMNICQQHGLHYLPSYNEYQSECIR